MRLLEIWMWLALGTFYVLTANSPKERKLWEVVVALGIAVWIFRGARSVIARRKAQ